MYVQAESKLRAEAEENLSYQQVQHQKQLGQLENQLHTERQKCQNWQEKVSFLEAKMNLFARPTATV